jgi:hypothetical protein
MFWYQWARRDLQRGDLSALLAVTNVGRWDDPNPVRLQRLSKRGFIKKREDDQAAGDVEGPSRAALWSSVGCAEALTLRALARLPAAGRRQDQ